MSNINKRAPATATQRLKQDYLRIKKDPVPYICAEPLPSNILEWYGFNSHKLCFLCSLWIKVEIKTLIYEILLFFQGIISYEGQKKHHMKVKFWRFSFFFSVKHILSSLQGHNKFWHPLSQIVVLCVAGLRSKRHDGKDGIFPLLSCSDIVQSHEEVGGVIFISMSFEHQLVF